MNNFRIKNFIIKGLFNEYNVNIPLTEKVNIFIGENGMGKTTILNILYSVLSGKYEKLYNVNFEEIFVAFDDGEECSMTKQDIIEYCDSIYYPITRRTRLDFSKIFEEKELIELRNVLVHNNLKDDDILKKYQFRISEIYGLPLAYARRELERYVMNYSLIKGNMKKAEAFKKKISSYLSNEVLYFPTYRRIEEDMSKLGLDTDKEHVKDHLIRFGMADVEKTIKGVLDSIRELAIDGFAKLTGVLMNQYLNGNLSVDDEYRVEIDKLVIALDRIGEKIDEEDKLKIKNMVENQQIYLDDNKYLLNLIKNLIDCYDKQSFFDNKVKQFVEVCNSYLTGKKYKYDESNLTLAIYKDGQEQPIGIQSLSSGEKQVISIFSKLYLEENKECIILFDEPELSLSIKWQSKFLPDIMYSQNCGKLIAVTHSPFIFDNDFDILARYMGDFLEAAK